MPSKHTIKTYVPNTYYHLFNRGVEKRTIFQDKQDYVVFLSYLKLYLSPLTTIDRRHHRHQPILQGTSLSVIKPPSRRPKNYHQQINLLAYCLMPNHFHLMVHQTNKDDINHFMRSLLTKYSMYFNKKYDRVGPLFQGRYKAVRVTSEEQFLYLSKYIHRNPLSILKKQPLKSYEYSSYPNYLGLRKQTWLQPQKILSSFSQINPNKSYQNFVEESPIELSPSLTLE